MLEKVKLILKGKAPLILEAFQNGCKEEQFSRLEKIAGAKLPDEFKALYRDSNGFDKEHFANLFYGFPFSSLEVVTAAQEALKGENDKPHPPNHTFPASHPSVFAPVFRQSV